MKTPKEYTESIKNNILTDKILTECLYSINKRAKNCRDKIKEYKKGPYRNVNYEKQMEYYYSLKTEFLNLLTPKLIHKQFIGYERIRVYSYEPNYYELEIKKEQEDKIVWYNRYYSYEYADFVYFFDYLSDKKEYLYFLFYELDDYSFHQPISTPSEYPQFKIEEIEDFVTYGADIEDLLSVAFVDKVYKMITTKEFEFQGKIHQPLEQVVTKFKQQRTPIPVTDRQQELIDKICKYFKVNKPENLSKGKAAKWISQFGSSSSLSAKLKHLETVERNERLYKDYKDGLTVEELSEKYGISVKYIANKILKEFGEKDIKMI